MGSQHEDTTIRVFDFFEMFPDGAAAIDYFEGLRWNPIRQSQHLCQPLLPGTPEFFYLDPVVRSADYCAYRYHQNIAQFMKLRPFDSGVFQDRKVLNQ